MWSAAAATTSWGAPTAQRGSWQAAPACACPSAPDTRARPPHLLRRLQEQHASGVRARILQVAGRAQVDVDDTEAPAPDGACERRPRPVPCPRLGRAHRREPVRRGHLGPAPLRVRALAGLGARMRAMGEQRPLQCVACIGVNATGTGQPRHHRTPVVRDKAAIPQQQAQVGGVAVPEERLGVATQQVRLEAPQHPDLVVPADGGDDRPDRRVGECRVEIPRTVLGRCRRRAPRGYATGSSCRTSRSRRRPRSRTWGG